MFQPCFNWAEEIQSFNAEAIPKITADNRGQVLNLITAIGLEANQISQNSLEETPLETRFLIAKMCTHAANLFELDEQEAKARLYEDLALQFRYVPDDTYDKNMGNTSKFC